MKKFSSMCVKVKNVDEALIRTSRILSCAMEGASPRGMPTKELIDFKMIIEDPTQCIIMNPMRKMSYNYLGAEMLWYLSGDLSVSKIKEYASMWDNIADMHGNINSNYGHIVFFQVMKNNADRTQFTWCLNSLLSDIDSRQAVINFNQPQHKITQTKDFVCTIYMQFLIRDNKLLAFSHARSNDLIYGFCYDIAFFCFVHQLLYYKLQHKYQDLKLGCYTHSAVSMHVYSKHYGMLGEIGRSPVCASGNFKGISEGALLSAITNKLYEDSLFFSYLNAMKDMPK